MGQGNALLTGCDLWKLEARQILLTAAILYPHSERGSGQSFEEEVPVSSQEAHSITGAVHSDADSHTVMFSPLNLFHCVATCGPNNSCIAEDPA